MNLIVQKFGGTSVANAERVRHVAQIITDTYEKGNAVIAVVSAQGDTTDDLIAKAAEITHNLTQPVRPCRTKFLAGSFFVCYTEAEQVFHDFPEKCGKTEGLSHRKGAASCLNARKRPGNYSLCPSTRSTRRPFRHGKALTSRS